MKKTVVAVVLIVMMIFTFAGCKSAAQRAVEDAYEDAFKEAIQNADEEDFDNNYDYEAGDYTDSDDGFDEGYENEAAGVDDGDGNGEEITVDTGDNKVTVGGGEWPDDSPADVPEFTKGTISGVIASPNGTAVTFMDTTKDDALAYINELKNNGYTLVASSSDDDWESFSGQKGDLLVTVEWDIGDTIIIWEQF